MRIRSLGMIAFTVAGCVGLLTAACSDDPSGSTEPPSSTPDSGSVDAHVPDANPPPIEAGPDVSAPDADAGVKVTATTGMTGWFQVEPQGVIGEFRIDETIIRTSDAPECVAFMRHRSRDSQKVNLGLTITVGGDLVGQDGGMPSPLTVPYVPDYGYHVAIPADPSQFIYQPGTSSRVQVEINGVPDMKIPGLGVTTLRSSPFPAIEVLTALPPLDDAGMPPPLPVNSKENFTITWNVPTSGGADAGGAGEQMMMDLWFIQGGAYAAEIRCGAPIAAGKGSIPSSLVHEIKTRLSPNGPIDGAALRLRSGDRREVFIPAEPGGFDTVYLFELAPVEGTTFAPDYGGDYSVTIN